MANIRPEWLARTDAAVERLTDDLSTIDVRASIHLLRHFIDTLDAPPDSLHGSVLATILMDVCGRAVQVLHEQNPPVSCSCTAAIWSHVSRTAEWRVDDPRPAFRDWLTVFFAGIEQDHPADAAVRAAQVIRRQPQRTWTLAALAAAADSTPAALRREFHSRFGIRPAAYVHLARVTRALGLLRSPAKVETVANDLGYKSKKDLYAALSRWADVTPTVLRSLSDDESQWLERELKLHCLRGVPPRAIRLQEIIGAKAVTDAGRGSANRPALRR